MSAATPIAIVSHQNALRSRQKPSVLEVRCVAKKSLALSERIYFGLTSSMVAVQTLLRWCHGLKSKIVTDGVWQRRPPAI